MAKLKAIMLDAENAVLHVQALKDADHPLADSEAVEYMAYRYVRQEVYGYDYDE